MKMKVFLSSVIVLLIMGLNSFAQPGQRGGKQGRGGLSAEWMVKELKLDDTQAKKVKEVNANMIEKMKKLREDTGGDRETMRSQMQKIRKEQNAELKKILTDEQYKTLQEKMKARQGQRGGQGNRQRRY